MSNDEILTVKETAVLLKTTRQQVRKMIANEELPAFWSVARRSIQLSYTYIYRFSPATVCILTAAGENVNRIF